MLRYTGASACELAVTAPEEMSLSAYALGPDRPTSGPDFATKREVSDTMANPLVARLGRFGPLSAQAVLELHHLTQKSQARAAGHPLFLEDSRCDHVCVLLEGVACRYRMLSGGRRQILGYILPGDLCDVEFVTVGPLDHSVGMLTDGAVVKIASGKLLELLAAFPCIRRAVEMSALIDKSILRQWLLNLAQRSASERLCHFLCEFLVRMEHIDYLNADGSIPFAINQMALADTLGMSVVHVNRTLQALRASEMIVLRKRHLHVLDRKRLAAMAGFDPGYLRIRENIR